MSTLCTCEVCNRHLLTVDGLCGPCTFKAYEEKVKKERAEEAKKKGIGSWSV